VLLDAGGEVVLVLPNVDGLDEILDDLERRLLEDTDGVLTLYAARTGPHKLDDIEKFRDLWRQREDAVARRKAAYRDYSAKAGGTPNAKSQRAQYSFHSSVCQFCGRPAETVYVKELDLNLCKLCNNEFEAGKAARNLQALVVARGRTDAAQYAGRVRAAGCELSYFAFLDYTVYVMGGTACAAAGVAARLGEAPSVYLVNNPRSFIGGEDNVGYGFIFTNQHFGGHRQELRGDRDIRRVPQGGRKQDGQEEGEGVRETLPTGDVLYHGLHGLRALSSRPGLPRT
jgi:CRISPR-associated protein Csm1